LCKNAYVKKLKFADKIKITEIYGQEYKSNKLSVKRELYITMSQYKMLKIINLKEQR